MDCICQTKEVHHASLKVVKDVGEHRWAEIDIRQCALCGALFLAFFHESEGFSRSGVWYLLPIKEEQIPDITIENARDTFENAEWCWAGGSYFDGDVHRRSGKLSTAP